MTIYPARSEGMSACESCVFSKMSVISSATLITVQAADDIVVAKQLAV